ncbi:uncharacterized protein J3R85_015224 [Psidium guajava]|nr:uncharacterized protein J3R85_015224 [Psidium guajava]
MEKEQKDGLSCREQCVTSVCWSFGRRCSRQVREHKARFYIFRRCLAFLLCWQRHELKDSQILW